VHERTVWTLAHAQHWSPGRTVLRLLAGKIPQEAVHILGLSFPNILGLAAGFDKDARVVPGMALLGFGHIEVGTITPRPQEGNPKPRIFRLPKDDALVNRMGFPSSGAEAAVLRIRALSQSERHYVLGVSLGKQKETPLVDAITDYLAVLHTVFPYSDYLAVNISSPNTPELRKLQGSEYLGELLGELMSENRILAQKYGIVRRPLLIKIAPDLTWQELDDILQIALDHQIDGVIAANTTICRESLEEVNQIEQGGLSGQPLALRSTQIIDYISRHTNDRLPIIGVGGIRTAADVQAKIDAGASLVQLYTALVYEGPGLAGNILRELNQQPSVANR